MRFLPHLVGVSLLKLLLFLLLCGCSILAEHVQELTVSEGVPVGHRIGYISNDPSPAQQYFIVPAPGSKSSVDADLVIDHQTGEIKTKRLLDREIQASYAFVAIPQTGGDNIRVVIKVLDENDNPPMFPVPVMHIEFPENTPRDVKRTLYPAKDADADKYNTQKYNIISGNVNNAFKLAYHRERDSVLYLDLQINGLLDREITSSYTLVIEALDGGTPPLRGQMIVNITIQDVNDNQPIFNQSRYFATVLENATVHTSVLQVYATDVDEENNGLVEYYINRRQSDKDQMFRIDSKTGMILVNKPLDFETKELHELVIVARDNGDQPLETTAFVTIKVIDINDNQPIIDVIFLSDDATPKISENAQPGEFVARISVNDPDSKTKYSNVNVSLAGGEGHFGLTTRDNIIYLMIVSLPLDRELKSNYTLDVVATDKGAPPLHASKTIYLRIIDVNDNAPIFEQQTYHAKIMEVADPGTLVIQVTAIDEDEGNNSLVIYSLQDTPDTHSQWFQIDQHSGLITTQTHIDCETEPVPKLKVIARDNGVPSLSATATVLITIHDVNDNEPIFDQSFYNVSVAENETKGTCILTVSATDSDCGVNAMVNYTIADRYKNQFMIKSDTGEICITNELDYESRSSYEFPVIATDRGGLSTTAVVKILLTDVNDNHPIFYPREYNVSLRESDIFRQTNPIVQVIATDIDFGRFGRVTYKIIHGNDGEIFSLDPATGEVFVAKPKLISRTNGAFYHLNVTAMDGGDLVSLENAEIYISIIDSTQMPPIFEHARYNYQVKENAKYDTMVGSITAVSSSRNDVRYSIYSGDPDRYFSIDPLSGNIRVANLLDHESKSQVLLNIQAMSGDPPAYGHTQVNIDIEDVNDNSPEFEANAIQISIPENTDLGVPIYAAHAHDRDSGKSGVVSYYLVNLENSTTKSSLFSIDPKTGALTLLRHLDYESRQRHALVVTAVDLGDPPLSANLSVQIDVQDVNDNVPMFNKLVYTVNVSEGTPINTKIIQVEAIDYDTGNNARITYKIEKVEKRSKSGGSDALFGIFPNNGEIYLRGALDREVCDYFNITILASDNGTPIFSSKAHVILNVLDENDNSPKFVHASYEFFIAENLPKGVIVGFVRAVDSDVGVNAVISYSLIPSNSSFLINPVTGEISTKESLDRESQISHDIIVEARDQGHPVRSTRSNVKIIVKDVNDNAPDIVDPQDDVIIVREGQPIGTEVVKVRAIDRDDGANATVQYSIIRGRDSDGFDTFDIDVSTGMIRTKKILDHEEKNVYRLTVAATDTGLPPKQTIRVLRIEVLGLHDNRPTFTSSSVVFRVREDVVVGHVVGSIMNINSQNNELDIQYTVIPVTNDSIHDAFEVDYQTGSLVVAKQLDREVQGEFKLEIRCLDITATHPQSSAIMVKIQVADVNDNAPAFPENPIVIVVTESARMGSTIHNFTANDADSGRNGEIQYRMDSDTFSVDPLTGALTLIAPLDHETTSKYILTIFATDQSSTISERHTTSATVEVVILDENDNDPRLIYPSATKNKTIYLNDHLGTGQIVSPILAIDPDSGDYGRIQYSILSGNEEGYFDLDAETGNLKLAKPLRTIKREVYDGSRIAKYTNIETSKFNLVVNVEDMGGRSVQSEIRIVVIGAQNIPPRFSDPIYYANISESVPVGSFVVRANAKSSTYSEDNITYSIPKGVANDLFVVDPIRGIVTTKGALDRELRATYVVPIYARDQQSNSYGIASALIRIIDVNDNRPIFGPEACSTLLIPENQDTGIIHIVLATDKDADQNGEITYSITDGNTGNRFSIDSYTGELSAKPLDREQQAKYVVQITAQDRGIPMSYQSTCNLTIMVEDENDNSPRFEKPRYSVVVSEGMPLGHNVVTVKAYDPDGGSNGRIHYSMQNEEDWMFTIDSYSGIISTGGYLDREKRESYNLIVVATDGGKSNARSEKVDVEIIIEDANDNSPVFESYPYATRVSHLVQPGQTLLTLSASDPDFGINGEVVYELIQSKLSYKFRLDLNTGVLASTQSLSNDEGRTIYLEVLCKDKGQISRSSINYIEIKVGENAKKFPQLRFTNSSYTFNERSLMTLHTSEPATLTIVSGNDDDTFTMVGNTLHTRGKPIQSRYTLGVIAKNQNGYAFTEVKVNTQTNTPRFTQPQYTATLLEGKTKGSFVAKVKAMDDEESRFLYHIVDGNHDNAFIIEPAFSGMVKTNIVLDREIRDHYKLKIIATNVGVPQMTGTSTLLVRVLDANDNQPTFPQNNQISVAEDQSIGASVAQITANDVDTFPSLTYSFSDLKPEYASMFTINRFNGKIMLKRPLDYEKVQTYKLQILVSDRDHTAETTLVLNVQDSNDNAPVFDKTVYQATVSNVSPLSLTEVITMKAKDLDTGKNAMISYQISETPGFSITDDTVYLNSSLIQTLDVDIVVTAQDHGVPPLKSVVPLKVQVISNSQTHNSFQNQYRASIKEDAMIGTRILSLTSNQQLSGRTIEASIIGEGRGIFGVTYPELDIILLRPIDRETKDQYKLELILKEVSPVSQNYSINVFLAVEDVNDNEPKFDANEMTVNISESVPVKSVIATVSAVDGDLGINSELIYRIVSGNDDETFTVNLINGTVSIQNKLDYDRGLRTYNLMIEACDSGLTVKCSLLKFIVNLEDANDHAPKFSLTEYFTVVGENEPIGVLVFQAKAIDLDAGEYGQLNYSLYPVNDVDGSWKNFNIDSVGRIFSTVSFDYEVKNHYNLLIVAKDKGGKTAKATLHVMIESRDEFPPVFTEKEYTFNLKPTGKTFPVGHVVGYIKAMDQDLGVDGRIMYQLTTNNPYFKINYTTGAITTKRKIDTVLSSKDISLVVTASSGKQDSMNSMTMVEIMIDNALAAEKEVEEGSWVIGLLITVLLFLTVFITAFFFIHWRKRGLKHVSKPRLNSENNTVNTNSYVDPSTFDTIPIRGSDATQSSSSGFAPPRYDEIPPYGLHTGSSGAATTSDLSTSDQSGSSGRGSAEDDGEDEEIRMINEGPLQREALNTAGRHSDVSVPGNRKYFTRMAEMKSTRSNTSRRGISDHHHPMQVETLQMYDEENEEADLTNLIYAKLNEAPASVRDEIASTGSIKQAVEHMIMTGFQQVPVMVQGPSSLRGCDSHSSVMHGEEDVTSNYNWDYLLDWGPQYQPLAHVFSEIARLKDDTMSVSGQSAASSIRSRNSLHHTIKHIPPPLITNVAPRLINATAPVISSRSSNASGRYSNANTQQYLLRSNLHYEQPHGFSTPSPMPPSFTHNLLPNMMNQSPSPNIDSHLMKK